MFIAKTVLVPLVNGFEEIETVTPVDILRRAGASVTIASVTGEALLTGRCGMTIKADEPLASCIDKKFDLLVIPGGPGVKALREDGRVAEIAQKLHAAGKPVAAICAAPAVLKDAGLLEGRRFSAHYTTLDELKDAGHDPFVEDGGVLTSRGAGTALIFGLALVRRLYGAEKEREIAAQIMA